MPINQARLIAQTNAAFLTLEALNTIRTLVHRQQSKQLIQSSINPVEVPDAAYRIAYYELTNLIMDDNALFPPNQAFAQDLPLIMTTLEKIRHLINTELQHFRKKAAANNASRIRARQARDSNNPYRIQRNTQQPNSLYESPRLVDTINYRHDQTPLPLSQPRHKSTRLTPDFQISPSQDLTPEERANIEQQMKEHNPPPKSEPKPSKPEPKNEYGLTEEEMTLARTIKTDSDELPPSNNEEEDIEEGAKKWQ